MAEEIDFSDSDVVLGRFNSLMQDLLRGRIGRNTFQPWEVELLLDIEACPLSDSKKREALRRYQKAVQRHVEAGLGRPLRLSEYLANPRVRRATPSPLTAVASMAL